jgi:ubiquinone/menaquinone biosynthesis C-methylase UbiE
MDVGSDDAKAWLAGVFDRAAPTYDQTAGAYHEHFGRQLVDRAGVDTGATVLDVACGRGAVLVPAAERIGPDGRLVGVDLSPAMTALALQALRDAGAGAGDTEVVVMDAEALEFEPASFDFVLCAFGVFFFPDPERAVAGFHRVLVPGGVVAVSTWGEEDDRWAWEDDLLAGLEVSRRAVVRPFDDAPALTALLDSAGFGDVHVDVERHDVVLADEEEWWAWKWSYSLRGMLEQVDAATIDALREQAFARLRAQRGDDGLPLRLTALLATGRA